MRLAFAVLSFLATPSRWLVVSQEAPNPSMVADLFDPIRDFRNDYCRVYNLVELGLVPLSDALQGKEISTFVPGAGLEFVMTDGVIDPDYPGIVPRLLDEICKRAGCTWRNSFTVMEYKLPEGKSNTDLTQWATQTYDLAADSYSVSPQRMRLGLAFMESWFDSSIILVGKRNNNFESQFDLWSWTEPFTTEVWLACVVTIVASAIVYNFMNNHLDQNTATVPSNLVDSTYRSAMGFLGDGLYSANAHGSRIFVVGMAMWVWIMRSAYTANLASALVTKNQAGIVVNTVSDVVRHDLKMCAFAGSNQMTSVQAVYPEAKLVPVTTPSELYMGVLNGVCDYALTGKSYWDIAKYDKESNPQCNLEWIGRPFETINAGFVTRADSAAYCTTLLRDVFNLHLQEMKRDGVLEEEWELFYSATSSVACDPETSGDATDSQVSGKMDLKNLGGIFVLYWCMIVLGFGVSLWVSYKNSRRETSKESAAAAVPKGDECAPSRNGTAYDAEASSTAHIGTTSPVTMLELQAAKEEINNKLSQILSALRAANEPVGDSVESIRDALSSRYNR